MADPLVEQGEVELKVGVLFPTEIQPYLTKTKEVEVVDEKSAHQQDEA